MQLAANQIIHYNSTGTEYRILWITPQNDICYRILLDKKGNIPEKAEVNSIEQSLSAGECRLTELPEGPFTAPYSDDPGAAEKRDSRWNLIKDCVQSEPDIYDPRKRAEMLKGLEEKSGVSVTNLYKYLGKYWKLGKTPNALLGDYHATGRNRKDNGTGYKNLGRPRTEGAPGKDLQPEDHRNFSDAVRRYYLNEKKSTFQSVYERLLRDHYSRKEISDSGETVIRLFSPDQIPSITQFRYWYKKNRDIVLETKKREGENHYNLNGRAVTGRTECRLTGPGSAYQIDATIADIYLVSSKERSSIVGRPTMYFVMDAFSHLVTGMHITLEHPSWEAAGIALQNAAENKQEFCKRFGVDIAFEEWPCMHLPTALIADRGEIESHAADCLASELGIRIENMPPYRGDLKGIIEQHFRLINLDMTDLIPGKVKKDFGTRGAKDYRLDAVLDIRQFTRIIIRCVLFYNNSHYMKDYRKQPRMRELGVRSVPLELWNYGMRYCSGALRTMPLEQVRHALLPKGSASITEKGIRFRGLYYTCTQAQDLNWFETARMEGRKTVTAAYDPRDTEMIYLKDDHGHDIECYLTDSHRASGGQTFSEHQADLEKDRNEAKKYEVAELEGAANLNAFIDSEVDTAKKAAPSLDGISKSERLKAISENRKKERQQNQTGMAGQESPPKDMTGSSGSAEFLTPVERMLYEMAARKNGEE